MNISVVIPTYNYSGYIRRAIDSVLSQTRPVSEILVIDDGSTDITREIVETYGPPVRYIYQTNQGVAAARNRGVHEAHNDWVAFLDADDWWLTDKIARQTQAIRNSAGAALVYSAVWFLEPDGKQYLSAVDDADRLWPMLRCRNTIATSSVLARKDAVVAEGGFNTSLSHCEDWDLWVRLRRRHEFVCLRDPLSVYRVTPTSLTVDSDRMLINTQRIMESTLLAGLNGWQRRLWRRRILSAQLHGAAITAREAGNSKERALLWQSVCEWPAPWFMPTRWLDILQNTLGPSRYRVLSNWLAPMKRSFL